MSILIVCSSQFLVSTIVQVVGIILSLHAATKISNRAQGIATIASRWHTLMTCSSNDSLHNRSSDSLVNFEAANRLSSLHISYSESDMASYHKRQAFDASEKRELDWGRRFRIIEGIAQGVLYIHKYSSLKIIHRDLKASNILLDGALNPKISDFGTARIFGINQAEANTNRVVGTYGYMSPEYARYGHFSEKLDVFSFGVLLLEIVSGKKNAAFYRVEHSPTLAGWAWELWKDGRGMEVIDESVRETCRLDEALKCIHVGFLCVQEAPADRPTMSSVIRMLQGNESTSLPPSKEPAFSTLRNSSPVRSFETPTIFSHNVVTMSLPEGRQALEEQ